MRGHWDWISGVMNIHQPEPASASVYLAGRGPGFRFTLTPGAAVLHLFLSHLPCSRSYPPLQAEGGQQDTLETPSPPPPPVSPAWAAPTLFNSSRKKSCLRPRAVRITGTRSRDWWVGKLRCRSELGFPILPPWWTSPADSVQSHPTGLLEKVQASKKKKFLQRKFHF